MTAVTPSGALPVWIVTLAALGVIVAALAVHARPSRHERSVRRYRGEWRE